MDKYTLNIEKLQAVKKVIAHSYGALPCPDGLASAMIIRDVMPDAQIVFMNYNTKEHDELLAEPGILFVDFTPPKKRVQEFVDVGSIVLDHHKHAKDIVEAFPEGHKAFADEDLDKGVSGALLTYRHVWRPLTPSGIGSATKQDAIRFFAKLAGIRDTWRHDHGSWRLACAQAEVLKFYPVETWMSRPSFDPDWIAEKMELGAVLLDKAEVKAKYLLSQAATFVSQRGNGFMVIPSTETSDVADLMPSNVKFLIGFSYSGKDMLRMSLSTRSRGDYDVGAFCKALAGGGHKNAAGASIIMTMADLNPYAEIVKLVEDYERGAFDGASV